MLCSSQPSDNMNGYTEHHTTLFPKVFTEFELYVMLERIGAMVSECPKLVSTPCAAVIDCQDQMTIWMKQYRQTKIFRSQSGSLRILWHSFFMLLSMDIDALECAAGREGSEMSRQHMQGAEEWARSIHAKNCIVHAIMLQRQFERMPLGAIVPIHVPACLYRCGVMWYCYLRFGNGDLLEPGHVEKMPEIEALGTETSKTLVEEMGAQAGKPSDQFLFRTIDLLQRISHWKVAERFAATLAALVDQNMELP